MEVVVVNTMSCEYSHAMPSILQIDSPVVAIVALTFMALCMYTSSLLLVSYPDSTGVYVLGSLNKNELTKDCRSVWVSCTVLLWHLQY